VVARAAWYFDADTVGLGIWIPQVAAAGLAIVTRDKKIQTRTRELNAVFGAGARMFAITSDENLDRWGLLEVFVPNFRAIEQSRAKNRTLRVFGNSMRVPSWAALAGGQHGCLGQWAVRPRRRRRLCADLSETESSSNVAVFGDALLAVSRHRPAREISRAGQRSFACTSCCWSTPA
jgi:hypothetical protein